MRSSLPVVAYFAAISNFPHANLRHYAFLNQGLPDVEDGLRGARGGLCDAESAARRSL